MVARTVVADEGARLTERATWPPLHHFLMSVGISGAVALIALLVVTLLGVAVLGVCVARRRRRDAADAMERRQQQRREDDQHSAALARCWRRFVWLVETASGQPASIENPTLGLGPELAFEILRGVLSDAERLGDDTLVRAAAVHLDQFSLVLAGQAGPISNLEEVVSHQPDTSPPPTTELPVTAASKTNRGRRREGK